MENVNRLTIKECVKRDGRRLMKIAEAAILATKTLRRFGITDVRMLNAATVVYPSCMLAG